MSNDLARSVLTILAILGSASFILAAIKMIFSFGQLVKGQDQLTEQARKAASSFEEFARDVRSLFREHDGRLQEVEKFVEVHRAVEDERRNGHGRRATDQP